MREIHVRVHIGSLAVEVAEPLSPGETRRLRAGIEAELASRIRSGGLAATPAHHDSVTVVAPAGDFGGGLDLARQIARSVHQGLSR
jgi:hypothetical protein